MLFKQLSLGFKEELDKRESEYFQVHVQKRISQKVVNQFIQLYKVKELLSYRDLRWCFVLARHVKRYKTLNVKQATVIDDVFKRYCN